MPVRQPSTAPRTATARAVAAGLPRQRPGPDRPTNVADRDEQRWAPRPGAARALQLLVLLLPITAAVVSASLLSALLPHADDLGAALGWWAAVVAGSTAAMWLVDRAGRRLLPLTLLLRLSLLFPDQAPKRFQVAAAGWNTRRLRERVESGRPLPEAAAPVEAATELLALLGNLAMHDRRTRGHCERVRAYNDLIAEELGLPQADRDRLRWAALIHDIGKLKVPARVLNKPGKPTAREWTTLRAHPLRGAQLAAPIADWLGPWADAIEQHHERWDGAGYPHGLSGADISLGARIVAVADAFEVMTSPRPYSRAMTAAAGRAEVAACAGTHFDPMVVRAFLNISLGRLRRVMGPVAWLMQVPFLSGMPRLEAAFVQGTRQAATGAGAAAGVVAVTTLTPGGHTHPHLQPVTSEVEVGAPGSPDAAGPLMPFVTQPATKAPATVHPAQHAVHAHHHATGKPASGQHHKPAAHRHRAGHPAVAESGGSAGDARGRCAGNAGGGLGNGGPSDGSRSLARNPLSALRHGLSRALGLHACD